MKERVSITKDLGVFDGLVFDAWCSHPVTSICKVRFVFFEHDGILKRAMLSNNEKFHVEDADTSIIPPAMRFSTNFEYAGFISWYGDTGRTVGSLLNLCNRCFGRHVFELIPNQVTFIKTKKTKTTKKDAFISRNYESSVNYTGQHGYHFSHSAVIHRPITNKYKYRIGVELEIEATNYEHLERIRKFESNWFFMERDGSLNEYGVEFVTIPLLPKDASNPMFWAELSATLTPIAKSWDSNHCGLHVHIGREILGKNEDIQQQTLGKLLYLYHHYLKYTRLNTRVFGREQGYHDIECKSDLVRAVDILGKNILKKKEMCDAIDYDLKSKCRTERYFDINVTNAATIEFRRGKGSLRPVRIAAVVQYCELLCKYAKKAKWTHISYDDFVDYLKKKAKGALVELLNEVYPLD